MAPRQSFPRLEPTGDTALTVRFGTAMAPNIHDRVLRFAAALERKPPSWLLEVVPTAHAVTIILQPGTSHARPAQWLLALARKAAAAPSRRRAGRLITVPVFYGGDHGPDLDDVARFAGMTACDVIRLHTGADYRVYFLGFAPGFPYLGTVPDAIAMPRLPTPRARVAAGSVGIAGRQTGIYPQDSPGGWRIIGRTSRRLYEPHRRPPFLFAPGDRVRFEDAAE